jgi:hypothetical protein
VYYRGTTGGTKGTMLYRGYAGVRRGTPGVLRVLGRYYRDLGRYYRGAHMVLTGTEGGPRGYVLLICCVCVRARACARARGCVSL